MKKTEPKERALSEKREVAEIDQSEVHEKFRLKRWPRRWHDAWMVHGHHRVVPSDYLEILECLRGARWKAAKDLLTEGYTLGFSAMDADEACAVAAHLGREMPFPIIVAFDEQDEMLYIVRDKNAKPVARKKAKAK